jgi:hypothetical protein
LRIALTIVAPSPGVAVAVQKGKAELHARCVSTGTDLTVEFPVTVELLARGKVDFRGPFVQGRPGARFVYVNWGTLAGQQDSCWTRRAKIWLRDLPLDDVLRSKDVPDPIPARIRGTAADGGPVCASVPLLEGH